MFIHSWKLPSEESFVHTVPLITKWNCVAFSDCLNVRKHDSMHVCSNLYMSMWFARASTETLIWASPKTLGVHAHLLNLTNDFYSWITWFLSTRSKSNWWQKKLDRRICRPPLFTLSRLCWWPLHLQMVGNMWCLFPSCSSCRVFRPTTLLSLTSFCTPAQHPAPSQVPTDLPCVMTKLTCNVSPLCTVHFGITC